MKQTWDNFWKNKTENFEWSQKDILDSKSMNNLGDKLLYHLNKSSLKGLKFLELGSGIGITSFFFASRGANVTLLDNSDNVLESIKGYWQDRFKYNFIKKDLFNFNPNKKYDVVYSFGLCEHFTGLERQRVLEKHIGFLSKGGIALISVPHKYGIFYQLQKKLQELIGTWSFGLEIPFSKKEFRNFAYKNDLEYEITCSGFLSSMYDFFIRKPLKLFKISTKRRFDDTSMPLLDSLFGSGILVILKKKK